MNPKAPKHIKFTTMVKHIESTNISYMMHVSNVKPLKIYLQATSLICTPLIIYVTINLFQTILSDNFPY